MPYVCTYIAGFVTVLLPCSVWFIVNNRADRLIVSNRTNSLALGENILLFLEGAFERIP
jgi:hypothetical protein